MKSVPKLIRRFLIILLLGTILLFALNILVLFILASRQTPGASPWTTALETGAALQKTGKGSEYILPEEVSAELAREHAWGILIDNTTHQVVWHTNDLPAEIPLAIHWQRSLLLPADISWIIPPLPEGPQTGWLSLAILRTATGNICIQTGTIILSRTCPDIC